MKLHYMGKYSGNPEDLPHGEHKPGAVMFKEPDMKKMAIWMNIAAFVISIILLIIVMAVWDRPDAGESGSSWQLCLGAVCTVLVLFPHEIIHGLCFKGDVYLYTNLKQGMLFVVGPEDMTKLRFVMMSLAPLFHLPQCAVFRRVRRDIHRLRSGRLYERYQRHHSDAQGRADISLRIPLLLVYASVNRTSQ